MVAEGGEVTRFKVFMTFLDRNLAVGKEELFVLPIWWSFTAVETGDVLRESLEWMKAFGVINYFLEAYEEIALRSALHDARAAAGAWRLQPTAPEPIGSLKDGVIVEAIFMCSYGWVLSVLAFIWEHALKYYTLNGGCRSLCFILSCVIRLVRRSTDALRVAVHRTQIFLRPSAVTALLRPEADLPFWAEG